MTYDVEVPYCIIISHLVTIIDRRPGGTVIETEIRVSGLSFLNF